MKVRIASIIILFIAVIGFLMLQAMGTGTSQVLLPSEALALERPMKRIRVAGRVSSKEVNYQVEPKFKLEFQIYDPDGQENITLPVTYAGIKPDMFASGRDVIIDGEISDNQLIANQLLTQCPSKYEPPTPGGEDASKSNNKFGSES